MAEVQETNVVNSKEVCRAHHHISLESINSEPV